jgi:hypothetical protein
LMNVSLSQEREEAQEGVAARFLKWELHQQGEEPGHSVTSNGPVQAVFYAKVHRPLPHGDFGFSLLNTDGQIVWGAGVAVSLEPGLHRIVLSVPMLPLKPGTYYWAVVLFSEKEIIDQWQCYPQITVSTVPLASIYDQYAGILNLPFEVRVDAISE